MSEALEEGNILRSAGEIAAFLYGSSKKPPQGLSLAKSQNRKTADISHWLDHLRPQKRTSALDRGTRKRKRAA
jgi:hypothetical protein